MPSDDFVDYDVTIVRPDHPIVLRGGRHVHPTSKTTGFAAPGTSWRGLSQDAMWWAGFNQTI